MLVNKDLYFSKHLMTQLWVIQYIKNNKEFDKAHDRSEN